MFKNQSSPEGIKREPVIGIQRVPIKGVSKQLQWDDVYSKLVNLIKYAARNVALEYNTGAAVTAEDLFQEGQIVLYQCYEKYMYKPYEEFATLFRTSLWRKLRDIAKRKRFQLVDLEDAYDLGYTEDVVEDLYNEYRLQQVAEMLESTPIALTIFKEFVNPSQRTLWEARMDIARKDTLKRQSQLSYVPQSTQVKGTHIQRALEISKTKFKENFTLVKQCVSEVYGSDDSISLAM